MLKKIYLSLLIVFCAMAMSFAQSDIQTEETPVKITDKSWADRGFDFFISGGMLFGDKFNANYYNGSNLNENNLDYIFKSSIYWYKDLKNIVAEYYPHISNTDEIYVNDPDAMDWNLHYKLSMMVSLGARYKLGKGWAVALSYSFSRLTTSTQVLISSNAVIGNTKPQPVLALVGKEDRSMIDLSASYLFSQVNPIAKPFVELGIQFNYAKVKSFEAALLDENRKMVDNGTFPLLNLSDKPSYDPYAQTYDYTFGGPGFGFSGAAGLKIVCGKYVSIDPTFYCYFGRLGIYQGKNASGQGENKFTFNYGAQIRIVMSDFFFSNK
jgi:hypothetical protein